MSYPAPPGLKSGSQPPASLPARPPTSAIGLPTTSKPPSTGSSFKPAFTAFAPRSIASSATYRTNSPAQYSAPAPTTPVASYSAASSYSQPAESYPQPQYDANYSAAPQIRNPFIPTTDSSSYPPGYDAGYEAQVQQWQSAYLNKDSNSTFSAPKPVVSVSAGPNKAEESAAKTVQRSGGGTNWSDSSLLEWDPAHFRIFVGNLAGEVTDESLLKAFAAYPSVQKARVIRDKRTTKSKGYGFVSFSNGDDYFKAARELNGKYIGSHPVIIKKATTNVQPTTEKQKHGKHKGPGGHGKVDHGGVQKKQQKTKGGLKILG